MDFNSCILLSVFSFDDNVYVKTPRSARPSDKEKRGRKEHRERCAFTVIGDYRDTQSFCFIF